jgi:23S rRNA (pseudouridine1915-N3)-methyltransferase
VILKIAAVGKIKKKPLLELTGEYLKRIKHYAAIELVEIKDSNRKDECARLLGLIEKEKAYCIVLSEDGKEFTSRQFANKLSQIHRKVLFVIGGPDGLTDEVKKRADLVLAISKMTFPHETARMLLGEQLFRALNILRGGKYHND